MASQRPHRVDTVLFDLDDTLLDSYRARVQALQDLFARVKITGLDAGEFLAGLRGAPFQDALARLAVQHNIDEDLFTVYRRIYWIEQLDNVRLFPGIRAMLDNLGSRGFKLGVVTSKLRDFMFEGRPIGCIYEMKAVGIADIFSLVIGLEDVRRHKPHPEAVNLALDRVASQSEAALFVGDSAADIAAAHSAGCRSCLATWGIVDINLPPDLKPHYVINAPRELLALDCW
jgi:pyrophosphatase PpaX